MKNPYSLTGDPSPDVVQQTRTSVDVAVEALQAITPATLEEMLNDPYLPLATLGRLARTVRANNAEKGFGFVPEEKYTHASATALTWAEDRLDATAIALIHGEVSEMLEARRRPDWATDPSEHISAFTGFVEEGADVIIRVLDLYARLGLEEELAAAIKVKIEFNKSRPYKHGRTF